MYQNEPRPFNFHTHVETDGTVTVCSTTGTRSYRYINDAGVHRVSGTGDAGPGELSEVSALIPEPN